MNDLLIIQFAKWPLLGNVKTRLARSIGNEKALEVHLILMNEVLDKLIAAKQGDTELWLNEIPAQQTCMASIIQKTQKNNIVCKVQQGVNLGDKMADAIVSSLKKYNKVIIVGSDCPNISVSILAEASKALDKTDLVIGPAEDGGYVLIGASRFDACIFADVAWGQGAVFVKTQENARNLGFTETLLSESWDVDELADYERWLNTKNTKVN
mgnify:CR=1 FL=1